MTGVLKVLLWIYGVVLVIGGLGLIFTPEWLAENAFGFENVTNVGIFVAALLGAIYVSAGVWLFAAGRDPLRHISWVKFTILKIALSLAVIAYALIKDYVEINAMVIVLMVYDFVWGVALLIFYPWRTTKTG